MEDAKLSYLCIYNPDLDPGEDNVEDQVVFAYNYTPVDDDTNLRRIGLAQGVVEFGRGFADGAPVSTLETTQSRLIVKKLEEPNWWVVAAARFARIPKDDGVEYNSKEVSTPEILVAEVVQAYRRWRMHHGSFEQNFQDLGRDGVVEKLHNWWMAWCEYWPVDMNREGALSLFHGVRYTKGELSSESEQVIQNTFDKLEGVSSMVITMYDPDKAETRGCVWTTGNLTTESVDDVVRWVHDCEQCDDAAFLDETGFVYHYTKGGKQQTAQSDWTHAVTSMNGAMTATMESMNNLMGMMRFKSMSNLFATKTPEPVEPPESEDLAESEFMVGLEKGNLDNEEEELDETVEISSKEMFLTIEDNNLSKYSIVVYRRRPFTFTLVYKTQDLLCRKSHYLSLHLKLASLVEPLNTDLVTDTPPQLYYIVHDPTRKTIRSSLPEIPTMPSLEDLDSHEPSAAEALVMNRLELIHVHHSVAELVTEWRQLALGGSENERFVRTIRNWWVYWCKLPDDREAVFARKWSKSSKPPDKNNGLLAVLGKESKQWLDNYRHYDRV